MFVFCLFLCVFVCVSVLASFSSFWQLLRYADKRIVNIMKVYIERNNTQVELIRFCKNLDFIHVYFCEATNAMHCYTSLMKASIFSPDLVVCTPTEAKQMVTFGCDNNLWLYCLS